MEAYFDGKFTQLLSNNLDFQVIIPHVVRRQHNSLWRSRRPTRVDDHGRLGTVLLLNAALILPSRRRVAKHLIQEYDLNVAGRSFRDRTDLKGGSDGVTIPALMGFNVFFAQFQSVFCHRQETRALSA